jgi:hypothetical protein
MYWTLCLFYFILDQNPLNIELLSVPIKPESRKKLLPVDEWIVRFAVRVESYMDESVSTSETATASFQQSPLFNYDEISVPPGNFKIFNKLFAPNWRKACAQLASRMMTVCSYTQPIPPSKVHGPSTTPTIRITYPTRLQFSPKTTRQSKLDT